MFGGGANDSVYRVLSREEKLKTGVFQDPIVVLVDDLLFRAIDESVSDIHLQPTTDGLWVRCRVDGVLYDHNVIDRAQGPAVISRLKVLASLDIAERRVPQDGRCRVAVATNGVFNNYRLVDCRLSTFPTMYGEKMVIRLLDRSLRLLTLDAVGLHKNTFNQLVRVSQQPHGLFLVTGPTGCGKTTMLYALLMANEVNKKNIVTIEDPIEYELAGVSQSQVNAKAGFTFDNGLRSMLRQDPDIIMIGEIRDKVTANIAIEAALTGHMVLSTLHTNNAASAVARLLEMGVEPFLISATLVGVLAQRLVRRLCPQCKHNVALDSASQQFFKEHNSQVTSACVPGKCVSCHNRGYKGRLGIFELLTVDDAVRSCIMENADATAIQNVAIKQGMKTLFDDGVDKINGAMTSIEELMQITVDSDK